MNLFVNISVTLTIVFFKNSVTLLCVSSHFKISNILSTMTKTNQSRYKKLIESCIEGDESAWEELVEKITPAILSVCRTMRLSSEESLDIFGQVCYLLLHNLSQLKSSDKIIGYVSTITRREILRIIRRKQLFDTIDPEIRKSISVTEFENPEVLLKQSESSEKLIKAVMQLPEKEYKLIRLLFLDETEPSYEEISKKLNIPVSSIGPTRIRILNKLKKILQRKDRK